MSENTILAPDQRPFSTYEECRRHVIENYAWVGSDQPMFLFIIDKLFEMEKSVKESNAAVEAMRVQLKNAEENSQWRVNYAKSIAELRDEVKELKKTVSRIK